MQSYPLTRPNRLRLARAFAHIPRVDISIDCVLEDQMGAAFVDSVENPQSYVIEQDHFFCHFAGDLTSAAGHDFLSQIPAGRMLMAGSPGWHDAVREALGERLMQIVRFSYSSESLSLDYLRNLAANNTHTPNVRRVDVALAGLDTPYLELGAFDSPDDFFQRGIGFCLMHEETIIGGAYSSLVCSDAIEVSIVVDPARHRQGIATALASQLLIWCMEHNLAPIGTLPTRNHAAWLRNLATPARVNTPPTTSAEPLLLWLMGKTCARYGRGTPHPPTKCSACTQEPLFLHAGCAEKLNILLNVRSTVCPQPMLH